MNVGLEIRNLSVDYGANNVIHELSLHVQPGELVALIGANGAGKTTLLRTLSGLVTPSIGEILWNGNSMRDCLPETLVRRGIVHVGEGKSVIGELTVAENLALGGIWRRDKNDVAMAKNECLEMFPILGQRLKQRADTLSGGERQMLAISRALISRPQLLLLDEPSLGLAPKIINEIFETIRHLSEHNGMTVLLVEQNAMSALKIADRGFVLNLGAIVASGTPAELTANSELRAAYLGI